MANEETCLFCQMAAGAFAVEKLHEDELIFAISDIAARAPVHILIIPRQHIASARELTSEQAPLLGHMAVVAQELARKAGTLDDGYRLAVNSGENAGQTIFHLHMHLLGGHKLGPEG